MNTTDFSVFGTQFTLSAVIVFLGHQLERWFPKLANVAPMLKRAAYWSIAAGAAIGVHAAFNSGTGTLVVTGLTVGGVAHGLWHWIQSVSLQEFIHGSTSGPANPSVTDSPTPVAPAAK
jgi:hypothetical protein